MTDSEEKTDEAPKTNLNEQWKGLDQIFQFQLRKYCDSENTQRFNSLAKELGFNTKQCGFLFDAIKTWTAETKELDTFRREQFMTSRPPILIPSISPNPIQNTNTNTNIFAIPSNRNESLCGGKRKRIESDSDSDDDDDDEYDVLKSPKRKKRKCNNDEDSTFDENEEMKHLWQTDANLTKKEQQELEEDNIYVVEAIHGHKKVGGNKFKYNVKWQGYDDLTWEPPQHLNNFMIKAYWKGNGLKNDKEAAMIMLQDLSLEDEDDENDDDYNDNDDDNDNDNDDDDDDEDFEMEIEQNKSNEKKKKDKDERKKKNKSPKKNKKIKSKSKSKPTSVSPKKKKKDDKKKEVKTKDKKNDDDIIESKEYRCEECDRNFKNGQALGGHNAARHKDKFEGKNKNKNKKSPKNKTPKTKNKSPKNKNKDKSKNSKKKNKNKKSPKKNNNKSQPYWEDSDDEREVLIIDEEC